MRAADGSSGGHHLRGRVVARPLEWSLEGGTGVNVNLPGTATRVDGSFHLTYADLPLYLYLYAADVAEGTVTNGRPQRKGSKS